jgi:multisubunit Na+/H+ antiporter MnhB subunit
MEAELMSSVRRNSSGSQPPDDPFTSLRALLIASVAIAAALAVWAKPGLSAPIGVGIAVVTLLLMIVR